MNLRSHIDSDLLSQIKIFVQSERDTLIQILRHLQEIERRRLFCDLGYKSLFEYAVQELKYSEGQAIRRIQAMRLLKDIPEVEEKISKGELSLTNIQQAQNFFRELGGQQKRIILPKAEKIEILMELENKTVREAQKFLINLQPEAAMPKERERLITATTSEVKFLMSDSLKAKLEEVRSLLGLSAAAMGYAELFEAMSELSLTTLKAKRFGKKRSNQMTKEAALPSAPVVEPKNKSRYVSREMKFAIWQRDQGRCTNCGNTRNLNYDHIKPVANGGLSDWENLRLLCFHCNQRASTKVFGKIFKKLN